MFSYSFYTGSRDFRFAVPDENFLYCAEHPHYQSERTEEEIICDALDHPIGNGGFADVPEDAKVIIIVDDVTRPTPTGRIIPFVMERLLKKTSNISFATAPGTHRPLTDEELELKIGREYMDQYPVYNIDYKEHEKYRYLTTNAHGTKISLHECVTEADFIICIGNIGPHNMVGWSGGAKMLQPGVSSEETTTQTHLYYFTHGQTMMDVIGNVDCEARQEIDEIGTLAGLNLIINTVLDTDMNIIGVFCGHHIKAHRAGVEFAEQYLCPRIPQKADIVIVSAYPNNVDYWQGMKPLVFSFLGLKKGGTAIYVFDPPEGLCNNSPAHRETLLHYLDKDKETVMKDLEEGKITDKVGIVNPLGHYQMREYANTICITNNLTEEECRLLGWTKIDAFEDALEEAFRRQGRDAKIGIIPMSGETVVRCEKA